MLVEESDDSKVKVQKPASKLGPSLGGITNAFNRRSTSCTANATAAADETISCSDDSISTFFDAAGAGTSSLGSPPDLPRELRRFLLPR